DVFGAAFPRVQEAALWREEWTGVPMHAHAAALQVLATLGIVGLLAGGAWLVTAALEWARAWRERAEARATLAAIAGLFAALLAAGATNVVGLAGATLFAVCGALPVALCARPEEKPARLHPAFPALAAAALLVFVCVSGERELSALAIAQPVREPAARGGTADEW